MKPLICAVVAVCLVIATSAAPENIAEVKELPQKSALEPDAEESQPQARAERCTTCGGGVGFGIQSPNVLARLQALPGAEVHSQSSFEGCSSDKGCAGIKVKDGRVIERFGNVDSFRQAASSDAGNEFTFHAAGTFGNDVFQGGIPKEGPFWWMNENSPFKAGAGGAAGAGGGASYEKFSKTQSSSFSSGGGASGGGINGAGLAINAGLDLSGNPFLNGDISKTSGFTSQGASNQFAAGNAGQFGSAGGSQFGNSGASQFGSSGAGKFGSGNAGASQFGSAGGASQFESQSSSTSQFSSGNSGQFGSAGNAGQFGAAGGANQFGAAGGASQFGQESSSSFSKPAGGSYQSSFESSSFSSSNKGGEIDISKNPFLNGGFKNQAGQAAFGGQASFGASAPASSNFAATSGNKFASSGYTGSSPSPFTASTAGSNVNLIQNTQKASEFDFEAQQQSQQNIDEIFQETGNVHAHEHSGGELQQTCAGQGYVCVHKAQCNNGVVNTNGAGILQAKTKKQYCNIKTEICCRIEISTLQGAGGLQGSLGVGSATYSGSGSQNSAGGGSIFTTAGQAGSSNAFGQEAGSSQGGNSFTQTSGFESSSSTFGSSGGSAGNRGNNFGGAGQAGQSGFNAQGSSSFASKGQGSQFGSNQGSGFQGNGFGTNAAGGNRGVTIESSQSSFESSSSRGTNFGANGNKFGAGSTGSGFNNNGFGSTGAPFGAGATNKFGATGSSFNGQGNEVIKTTNTQTNFIETDSFSAGSDVSGIYRPGASGLKPGVPYLPPVDNTNSGSSQVSQTAFSSTFAPTTPRPIYTTPKPTYLPPSTAAPGYLPPVDGQQTINTETRVPGPVYNDGSLILDESRFPNRPKKPVPQNNDIPSGCAAALKCTPIEFCTADGVISNTTVVLTRDQEAYRVPMTDCKDVSTGAIGKCCRDPYYTDPWPVNLIGKWAPGVFGGDDGKYTADSRGSSNIPRPVAVTVRPPVTGSVLLSPNRQPTPKPTLPPYGPNQVTPGFPSSTTAFGQKGQFEIQGQGQYEQRGQGQFQRGGQGQFTQGAQGQQFAAASQSQYNQNAFAQTQGQQQKGQAFGQRGQGQIVSQGQGQIVTQGQGQIAQAGRGQFGIQGQGQIEIQEQAGQSQFSQTQGSSTTRGQGQIISQGQGQLITQGGGTGIRQGQGFAVSQGSGFGVENEYSESVQRVFLSRYSGGGQCGVFNGQKPYGNRNDLEVDFAEIPWQAMVLLQTNKSLLCGGVITRPDVVITSAACVDGLQAKNVLIKGGEWKLGIDDEPLPFQIVQVKTILRHPYYKQGSLLNDVAILVLSENLRLAKNIYPICLPGAQETLDAYYNGAGECIVTGWGKQVLQAHLAGSILHSINVSLINPGECQAKLSQEYPHLLEQYDQDSCACGQPTNPINNICRVDIGSALACTTGDGHWVMRGVYSWDSGCQPGNQLAAFYKFDLEWYEWAIGLIESARFAAFGGGAQVSQSQSSQSSRFSSQINSGIKGGQFAGGIKGGVKGGFAASGLAKGQFGGQFGGGQSQYSQFSKYTSESSEGSGFQGSIKPIQNSFSASYSEKKVFQSEPKIITYTTKPEIVTFTTKPEIFTYTTKPKIVTYTTKPQIITYETSGSGINPQYVAPGVTYNPSFSELVGSKQHTHNAACKCNGKK